GAYRVVIFLRGAPRAAPVPGAFFMPESLEDKNARLVEAGKPAAKDRKKARDPRHGGEPGGGWPRRNLLLLIAMIGASLLLVNLLDAGNRVEEKTYSEFRRLVADTSWNITA